MVQIYQKKWKRNGFVAFFLYVRDALILFLPFPKYPVRLIRLLYGVEPRFVFFVHPRSYEDVFISSPFLTPMKFLFRKNLNSKLLSAGVPFVVSRIKTKQGVDGLIIGAHIAPELMLRNRNLTLLKLKRMLQLASKLLPENGIVGLGGWFPMVTKRGAALIPEASRLKLRCTNGHCGTLASIYLTVERILRLNNLEMKNMSLAIIGVGKMGSNIVRAFYGLVSRLILIDINMAQLQKIKSSLEGREKQTKTEIECYCVSGTEVSIREVLKKSHVGICATSSIRNAIRLKEIPNNYILIDDSRPEALPRDPKNERIILEGGLLKINGAVIDYDFGLGLDENVFGCLGESFVLSLQEGKSLKATVGEVDPENFSRFLEICRVSGVTVGDFKSNDRSIEDDIIYDAFQQHMAAIHQ